MIQAKHANLSALAQAAKARALKDAAALKPPPAAAAKLTFSAVAARKTASAPPAPCAEDLIEDVLTYILNVDIENVAGAQLASPAGPLFVETKNEPLVPPGEENRVGDVLIRQASSQQYMDAIGDHTPRSRLTYTIAVEHGKTYGFPNREAHAAVGMHAAKTLLADPKLRDMCITDIRYNAARPRPLTVLYMHGPLQPAEKNGSLKTALDEKIGANKRQRRVIHTSWRPDTEGFHGEYQADMHIKAYGRMFFSPVQSRFLRSAYELAPPHRFVPSRSGNGSVYVSHDLTHVPTVQAHNVQTCSPVSKEIPRDADEAPQTLRDVRATENRDADGSHHPSATPNMAGSRQVQSKDRSPLRSQEAVGGRLVAPVVRSEDTGSTVRTDANLGSDRRTAASEREDDTDGNAHPAPTEASIASVNDHAEFPPLTPLQHVHVQDPKAQAHSGGGPWQTVTNRKRKPDPTDQDAGPSKRRSEPSPSQHKVRRGDGGQQDTAAAAVDEDVVMVEVATPPPNNRHTARRDALDVPPPSQQ